METFLVLALAVAAGLNVSDPRDPRSPRPGAVHGRVIDAQTGAAVARVAIVADGVTVAATDDRGEFVAALPARARVELVITAIGYGLARRTIATPPASLDLGTIALNRESAGVAERVTVTAPADHAGPAPRVLTRADLETLSMVLVDDPLRSVHALPGVVANNDLRAEFSLRGAAFEQIGVYVDGVRTGGFVHLLSESGTTDQLSLSVVNQDTIASAALTPGIAPVAAGGQTAGVLEIETREGNRERITVHGATGFLTTSGVVEGPLPSAKGSWLLAGRTTRADYVQQLIDRAARRGNPPDDGSDLQFGDVHAKVVVDLTPRQQLGFSALAGVFTSEEGPAGRAAAAGEPNAVDRARSGNWLRSVSWRFTPGARVFAQVRGFSTGSTYREHNAARVPLNDNFLHAAGVRAETTFEASSRHLAQVGLYAESSRQQIQTTYFTDTADARRPGAFSAGRLELSWYAQDRWSIGRSTATAGVRVESIAGETIVSPRLRVAVPLGAGWLVRAAAGMQAEAPPLPALLGLLGNPDLVASRSVEVDAGVEQSLAGRLTLTLDAYHRHDRDQLFALAEPRLENGRPTALMHPFQNSLDGRARGVEVAVRRDSARRVSGWIGYAFAVTRITDRLDRLTFPSDQDQRHTINAAGAFRVSGTFALSAQWRYGSGTPRPGFFQPATATLELGTERNTIRLPAYQRLDLKARKVYVWGSRTFTLSAEVLNVLNRKNEYNVTSTILSIAETGRYVSGLRQSFGVVPAVGLAIRF
jgi:outer membrane cobalamin receptor